MKIKQKIQNGRPIYFHGNAKISESQYFKLKNLNQNILKKRAKKSKLFEINT